MTDAYVLFRVRPEYASAVKLGLNSRGATPLYLFSRRWVYLTAPAEMDADVETFEPLSLSDARGAYLLARVFPTLAEAKTWAEADRKREDAWDAPTPGRVQ